MTATKDNLAVSVEEPRNCLCLAGCTKEQIRSALGAPDSGCDPMRRLRGERDRSTDLTRSCDAAARNGCVYCQTWVTVERQARSDRWVLRGVESGGSRREGGRYMSFFSPDGRRLAWFQRLDRIGANGVHAVVIGPD